MSVWSVTDGLTSPVRRTARRNPPTETSHPCSEPASRKPKKVLNLPAEPSKTARNMICEHESKPASVLTDLEAAMPNRSGRLRAVTSVEYR
jgi:hypothetical protein